MTEERKRKLTPEQALAQIANIIESVQGPYDGNRKF